VAESVRSETGLSGRAPSWVVILLVLVAACCGGETSIWGVVVPIAAIGILLVWSPIRRLPNRFVVIGICGLFVCAAFAFLPSTLFGESGTHSQLRAVIPNLPGTVTLQPKQTAMTFGVFVAVILFAAWVMQWDRIERSRVLKELGIGIATIAAVALANRMGMFKIPWWHPSQDFGPFANRNQTGNLFGLGSILMFGATARSIRGRSWVAGIWIVSFVLCLAGLIFANSRASLALLIVGVAGWVIFRNGVSIKTAAAGGGILLILCSVALVGGEQLARRFGDFADLGFGFRWKIYEDTSRVIADAPFSGIGMGNFEGVFPAYRSESLNFQRILHPESDWLWMTSEIGLGASVFCAVAVYGLLKTRVRPSSKGEKDLLFAGAIGVVCFLLHSFVDVPAHRLGTILPILVVAGICFRSRSARNRTLWLGWISRFFGCGLVAFAFLVWRTNEICDAPRQAAAAGNWPLVKTSIDEAIAQRPLDWSLYNVRAHSDLQYRDYLSALRDFRFARVLEPRLSIVSWDEGRAWLNISADLALDAWKDALRRGPVEDRNSLYGNMLQASSGKPELNRKVLRLGDSDVGLAMVAVASRYADVTTMESLTEQYSNLDTEHQRMLLLGKARLAAEARDFEIAYVFASKAMRPIAFPPHQAVSEAVLRGILVHRPNDPNALFNLVSVLERAGRYHEALNLLKPETARVDCPDYLIALQAALQASENDWAAAWDSIGRVAK
jgi:O-antigen ligase/tetratricopeptide (TPR) repeat protein